MHDFRVVYMTDHILHVFVTLQYKNEFCEQRDQRENIVTDSPVNWS